MGFIEGIVVAAAGVGAVIGLAYWAVKKFSPRS